MDGWIERLPLRLDRLASVGVEHLLQLLGRHPESGPQTVNVGRRLAGVDRAANGVEHREQVAEQVDLAVADRIFILPP